MVDKRSGCRLPSRRHPRLEFLEPVQDEDEALRSAGDLIGEIPLEDEPFLTGRHVPNPPSGFLEESQIEQGLGR